eukprot:CAMPEP_0178968380 /NCGR_PEP_ID=MMETSP0789-20121207/18204_1 /TAXON_ID=3005 /ORGANISM="Rhizosolenia setigera, Strain CCMP 1694" /LENGTH=88 /DNA_ID=CAMNT_0020654267 /DNA_START=44 /DNA_END=310 /DNA_ORIENTATION=+
MMKNMTIVSLVFVLFVLSLSQEVHAGPLAYGICQTGCNDLAVSCYAAAGFTFGTVTGGTGIPAVLVGCNASLGTCMAACVAAGAGPTP